MPKEKNNNWIFWGILFLLFCITVYALKSILLPFAVGITIGYLFDPLVGKLTKRGCNRTLAAILILALAAIIIIPTLVLLIGIINEQLMRFLHFLPEYISSLTKKAEPFLRELNHKFPNFNSEKIKEQLGNNASNALRVGVSTIGKIIGGGLAFLSLLSLLVITPVVTFYMLRDWKHFTKKIDDLLPKRSKTTIRKIAKDIDRVIAGFIRGQMTICLILGMFYGTALHITGLQLGFVIGFIAGIISFIPYVGSIFGFLVSMTIAFVQFDSYSSMLLIVGIFAIGQLLEGSFLTPKFIGESIGLHPVWVMFALLTGGVLLGFLGLLIAIPTAAVIGVLVRHSIENYKKSEYYLK